MKNKLKSSYNNLNKLISQLLKKYQIGEAVSNFQKLLVRLLYFGAISKQVCEK
jgi:hypothetical protein